MDGTHELLFRREYRDEGGRFDLELDPQYRIRLTFHGAGTMNGAHALVDMLDEVARVVPVGTVVNACIDLTELTKSPVRSQFLLGKWLIKHRNQLAHCAIFGARPWEKRLASAVMSIARFQRARFFDTGDEAADWLASV